MFEDDEEIVFHNSPLASYLTETGISDEDFTSTYSNSTIVTEPPQNKLNNKYVQTSDEKDLQEILLQILHSDLLLHDNVIILNYHLSITKNHRLHSSTSVIPSLVFMGAVISKCFALPHSCIASLYIVGFVHRINKMVNRKRWKENIKRLISNMKNIIKSIKSILRTTSNYNGIVLGTARSNDTTNVTQETLYLINKRLIKSLRTFIRNTNKNIDYIRKEIPLELSDLELYQTEEIKSHIENLEETSKLYSTALITVSEYMKILGYTLCPNLWKQASIDQIISVWNHLIPDSVNEIIEINNDIEDLNNFMTKPSFTINKPKSILNKTISPKQDITSSLENAALILQQITVEFNALIVNTENTINNGANINNGIENVQAKIELFKSYLNLFQIRINNLTNTNTSSKISITNNDTLKSSDSYTRINYDDILEEIDEIFEIYIPKENKSNQNVENFSNDDFIERSQATVSKIVLNELKQALKNKKEEWIEREKRAKKIHKLSDIEKYNTGYSSSSDTETSCNNDDKLLLNKINLNESNSNLKLTEEKTNIVRYSKNLENDSSSDENDITEKYLKNIKNFNKVEDAPSYGFGFGDGSSILAACLRNAPKVNLSEDVFTADDGDIETDDD